MISVEFPPPCKKLMNEIGITEDSVLAIVNHRDSPVIDSHANRLMAANWLGDGRIVFVDCAIAKRTVDPSSNQVHIGVFASIVLELRENLPSGTISKGMDMELILAHIAQSFGHPVVCHKDEPPSTLYSGPWDGQAPRVKLPKGTSTTLAFGGDFSPAERYCRQAYVVDVKKYKSWFTQA